MIEDDYLSDLNPQQRAAVEYVDGPQLVIAGAGSGKTRVLTRKIVHLLNLGYDPHRMLALTFTNKAAREMKERIADLVGTDTASRLWMGTFHSIFLRLLRFNADRIGFRSDFTIYDSADSRSLIKSIIKDMGLDPKMYSHNTIASRISKLKNALISPEKYASNAENIRNDRIFKIPEFANIYRGYRTRCHVANAMDFDDILYYMNILLRDNNDVLKKYQEFFQYILVDEYQDTNFSQHLIIQQLSRENNRICVVGDDAQSIYSFRGANIANILNLRQQFPTLQTFKLEQNYRSTRNIIEAANSLIAHNKAQIPKNIFSNNSVGEKIQVLECYSGYEEAYVIAGKIIDIKRRTAADYNDFAILFRTNSQSRILEEALRKRNIPYHLYGNLSFYQRKEIKDVIAYMRLTVNPDDDEALRRIINFPARGIGETTLGKLVTTATKNNVSLWNVMTSNLIEQSGLSNSTKKKITDFTTLIKSFIDFNLNGNNAANISEYIIKTTGLLSMLQHENTPENISKQENIQELQNAVIEFVQSKLEEGEDNDTLSDFLSEVSLQSDLDNDAGTDDSSRVTLMTVHSAKGLEFKNVFISGAEEELFPSHLSLDSLADIEEERRLMYVAITRAQATCTITFADTRFHNGKTTNAVRSRFINDIDSKYLQMNRTSTSGNGVSYVEHDYNKFSRTSSSNKYNYESAWKIRDVEEKPKTFISRTHPSQTQSSTSSETFTIHSINEVSVGNIIHHSMFGRGEVLQLKPEPTGDKMIVRFDTSGQKTLLLKFAKFIIEKQ